MRKDIYEGMGLDKYKKTKDSTINYVKKVYGDSDNLEVIIARIRDVIYYISGFDISFYYFLTYNYSKDMCDFIYNNIAPMGNIFKDEICKVIDNPSILTEIRIAIQNIMIEEAKRMCNTTEEKETVETDE